MDANFESHTIGTVYIRYVIDVPRAFSRSCGASPGSPLIYYTCTCTCTCRHALKHVYNVVHSYRFAGVREREREGEGRQGGKVFTLKPVISFTPS